MKAAAELPMVPDQQPIPPINEAEQHVQFSQQELDAIAERTRQAFEQAKKNIDAAARSAKETTRIISEERAKHGMSSTSQPSVVLHVPSPSPSLFQEIEEEDDPNEIGANPATSAKVSPISSYSGRISGLHANRLRPMRPDEDSDPFVVAPSNPNGAKQHDAYDDFDPADLMPVGTGRVLQQGQDLVSLNLDSNNGSTRQPIPDFLPLDLDDEWDGMFPLNLPSSSNSAVPPQPPTPNSANPDEDDEEVDLTPLVHVPPSPVTSVPPAISREQEVQDNYDHAFEDAIRVVAEQRSGFVGADHSNRVVQSIYATTRRCGRIGEAVGGFLFKNEAAAVRREEVLEQYADALEEFSREQQLDHAQQIDFRLSELDRFEEQVEFNRHVNALRESSTLPSRGRQIVGAVMSSPIIAPVVGAVLGAGAALKANAEHMGPAGHIAMDLGAVAVAGLVGYVGTGVRERGAIQQEVSGAINHDLLRGTGVQDARDLRHDVEKDVDWDAVIQGARNTIGEQDPNDQIVPFPTYLIDQVTSAQISENSERLQNRLRQEQPRIRRQQLRNAILAAGSAALAAGTVEAVEGLANAVNSATHQGAQHANANPTATPNHQNTPTPTKQPTQPTKPPTGTDGGGAVNHIPSPNVNVNDVPYNVASQVAKQHHMNAMDVVYQTIDKLNAQPGSDHSWGYTTINGLVEVTHHGHVVYTADNQQFNEAIIKFFG